MAKRNAGYAARKEMLADRRERQLARVPTKEFKSRGKYIPAGIKRNTNHNV